MKAYFFIAIIALSCISCNAQTVANTATNRDGSLTLFDNSQENKSVYVTKKGNVGIGLKNPQDKLEVNGQIHARSVKIDIKNWADFVFKEGYDLPRLRAIESYINKQGHLPDVPSAQNVTENGIELGEMQKILLQKVEELTLYLIEQDKEIEKLKKELTRLKDKS
jgi:hypothetical protein